MIINPYNFGVQSLLDFYPSSQVAFSIRKLRLGYNGPAMTIRRTSNNQDTDIYFLGDGSLDTASILSWIGASDANIVTWYDQSGNGSHAQQATLAFQPKIAVAGAIIEVNGKPAILFDGSDDELSFSNFSIGVTHSAYSVFDRLATAHRNGFFGSAANTGYDMFIGVDDFIYSATTEGFIQSNATNLVLTQSIWSDDMVTGGSVRKMYRNDVEIASTWNPGAATRDINTIGKWGGNLANNHVQEGIIWLSDQSANRSGILSNINDYYSIY